MSDRFWSQVDKDGPEYKNLGCCWLWTGVRMPSGYGRHQHRLTHRLAWVLAYGPVPSGLCVLHRCDNPPCVNPNHLFLGTQQDNLADMRAKGRQVRGENQGASKLTEDQVRYIKSRYRRYSHKDGAGAIARELGVGLLAVWKVVRGKTWRHV